MSRLMLFLRLATTAIAASIKVVSDILREGHTAVEQRWSHEDFRDVMDTTIINEST